MPDEAVVFSDGAGKGEARTHVLLVGVGHYPNFANGTRRGDPAPLKDLKAPAPSVRELADWFIGDYNYPPAPLGSVALLISEDPPQQYRSPKGQVSTPPVPTYQRFEGEALAWLERGNGNEDSRLIFFFCGHGYGYSVETSLLMADFDFSVANPWNLALDLSTFKAGNEEYKAAEQLFFIDACRRPHGDLIQPKAAIGRSPTAPSEKPREGYRRKRKAPVFFSTGNDEPARAKVGETSVFTQAFLRAVRGMGARDDSGDWQVSSLAMLEAIDHVSKRLTEGDFADPQQPQGEDARSLDIHCLKEDPVSPLYVARGGQPCGPGELRYDLNGKAQKQLCTVKDKEIALWLPYGEYDLELSDGASIIGRADKARSAPIYKKAMLRP